MIDYEDLIVHYHEIGLKGRNRAFFENRLKGNLLKVLRGAGVSKVDVLPGRLVAALEGADLDETLRRTAHVFGVSHFSPALRAEPEMNAMVEGALRLAEGFSFRSFEVRARKGYTSFEEPTQRIHEVVGQALKDHTRARVDLTNPDWTCGIELVGNSAFLYGQRLEGPGGLPVGVSGKALALLSGGIDSPVAAWEVAKRGASVELIHFHGQPYSDASSVRQATALAGHLSSWLLDTRLWLIPFGDIQSEIVTSAPEELRVVLYRRFMMRIAQALAKREGHEALITGESLGQVASQTLPNLTAIDRVVTDLPVLRPVVGRDKLEIEFRGKEIGTYEISIRPHQDCCVLFVPRNVTTRATISQLEDAESRLDVAALVDKGLANAEVQRIAIN